MQSFASEADEERFRTTRACRNMDPGIFFINRGETYERARKVCDRCPVTEICFSLYHEEDHGFVAGMSPEERKALRRRKAS